MTKTEWRVVKSRRVARRTIVLETDLFLDLVTLMTAVLASEGVEDNGEMFAEEAFVALSRGSGVLQPTSYRLFRSNGKL
ncbi:unnamed protein product [Nezara viridula]|uniref:Uncharacterized protein n=1 Tax=Nezara viridula TaxID=85310 RepID=A0A9P0HJB4_NEZVI|nr:unnamed protein product [Nezara viridula]